ncbi:MAG: FtsQ-type POTRA domain-containing protein [Candidatus Eremiobacteraeota bacterium]|nr:FtsQ-type POTRA domain-containing protein [Candidatus Eremiobacteraeota bacterium]
MSRKRRKKNAAARLRPFWVLLLLALVIVAGAGYYAVGWPGFEPKQIAVISPPSISSSEILQRAQISLTNNIWLQNMRAAAARVRSIPYVLDARIHRGLPAKVSITVTARTPFALLQTPSQTVVIDRGLRVLEDAGDPPSTSDTDRSSLPRFILRRGSRLRAGAFVLSSGVQRMRTDYDLLLAGHVAARTLSFDRYDQLIATLENGVQLLLGDDAEIAKAIPQIDPILSQVKGEGRKIKALDLRAPNTPVVVYK